MGVRVEVYWGIPGPLEPPGVIEGEKITEHDFEVEHVYSRSDNSIEFKLKKEGV